MHPHNLHSHLTRCTRPREPYVYRRPSDADTLYRRPRYASLHEAQCLIYPLTLGNQCFVVKRVRFQRPNEHDPEEFFVQVSHSTCGLSYA